MREVCFLISKDGSILWADASQSPVALPDSRERWEAIWMFRDELHEIAHSHPMGPSAFSAEDESTMSALDSALGRVMRYSVVAPRRMIARDHGETFDVDIEPWWAGLLRLASGMTATRTATATKSSRGIGLGLDPAFERALRHGKDD